MNGYWMKANWMQNWVTSTQYGVSKWFSDIKCWLKIESQNKFFKEECDWEGGEHRGVLDEVDKKVEVRSVKKKPYVDMIKMIMCNAIYGYD